MFGYIRPRRDELRMRDLDAYRAAYCGLCRAMGRRYGFRTRWLVNYDFTFLYLLLASVRPEAERRQCWCPARVLGRKPCLCDEAGYAAPAACNLILCWWKLDDEIRDGGFLRRFGCRLLRLLLRRPYRRAAKDRPAFDALAAEKLAALRKLETDRSPSLDATADAFAAIVAGCAAEFEDPSVRRPAETLLYQVGRFIYLADALDDLRDDVKKDTYNPLRYRFCPTAEGLAAEDLDWLSQLVDSSVNLAGAALALLPVQSGGQILENIVYLGMPAVFAAVRAGRFQKHPKRIPRKEINE